MIDNTVELDQFPIIGVSVKTSNKNGQSQKDIGDLFATFMQENVFEKIPNKATGDIYCVYTEYEGDFNAPYTAIIGCKVFSLENIPDKLVGKTIPKTKYQVYKSVGKLPDCVGETWNKIWQSDIDRKYIADFDVYGPQSQDPMNAEVDTYLSINE